MGLRASDLNITPGGLERGSVNGLTIDDFVAAKRKLEKAMPSARMYGVKLSPFTADALSRPAPHKALFLGEIGDFCAIPLFRDPRVAPGKCLVALDRATVDAWVLDEWRLHLIAVLKRRSEEG